MRIATILSVVLAGSLVASLPGAPPPQSGGTKPVSHRPELEYLEAVNRVGPPRDPQMLFLLMALYSNANLQARGVEFFSDRLKEFEPRLTDIQKALYLSAIGLLRAQHAPAVPLLRRIRWVKDTLKILDQAKQLSGGQVFVVNWIDGVVRAQLPARFHQRKAAQEELAWCLENVDKAPHSAWLREVYYQLARLAADERERGKAEHYLRQSGYTDFHRPIALTTPFSEDRDLGHTFSPRSVSEIVPGRVYALSGFEFTEYYFVVSDDGRELIGIDAGTRSDSARTAFEALRAYAPGLPELTTIFITHAHWDHVGGHIYFRGLNPRLKFYARNNYQDEVERELSGPANFAKKFFGERFSLDDVRSFKPDVLIDGPTELKIGGTRINLTPVQGGETQDALFIELPDLGTMFVGDFIMPYLGAPFVEEGNLQGLLDAIDRIEQIQPRHLLHGHEPLTRNFSSLTMLAQLKTDLIWLREQVISAIRRVEENAEIHEANLIPPDLLKGDPAVQLPYLIMREHVIDRLYDQTVGYWGPDLQGLNHISRADRAEILMDYLGVSEKQFVRAVERLAADGKYELAAELLESSGGRLVHSRAAARAERLIYSKLMEKHQNTDPFKFILYSAKLGEQTPQMSR